MDVHPQDKFLVISSDDDEEPMSARKRRKPTHSLPRVNSDADDGVAESKTVGGEEMQQVDCGESDSNGEPALVSSEVNQDQDKGTDVTELPTHSSCIYLVLSDTAGDTSSPVSSPNPLQDSGIRRREGMGVWHLSPGKRYFRHDRDSWPILPGQSFEIFNEKLEDQLAREALAASPLNYEHDDKENDTNVADPDSQSENHEGVSVIPASQYKRSSEERELSYQHAAINHTLYGDKLLQPYGLDGTHRTHQEKDDTFSEAMSVLASGGNLPRGQAQAKTRDSVLGPH